MAKAKSIVDETVDTEAKPPPVQKPNGDLVMVTVTKFGAGLVSTGQRDESGDVWAQRGDKLMVSKVVADQLEALGRAEID